MLYILDTSSIIEAWAAYPIEESPLVWEWIGKQLQNQSLCIFETAFNELNKSEECKLFLTENNIWIRKIPNNILLLETEKIHKILKIKDNEYSTQGGVSQNDIYIIASAYYLKQNPDLFIRDITLFTEEKFEKPTPQRELKNYKIPAVCDMLRPRVPCQSFLEYIEESGVVFK